MSGQQIGSVVGGVIGAYFGGPYGYAIGSAIGGAIGGYVDPTVIKGPRLTDATSQTANDGVPIPWGFGTFPTSGNIIWTSELFERKKEDDGKGSGIVNVTYHYYRSFAIGICQGVRQADGTYLPIEGILQVKENGKVVYDVSPGATPEQLAQNTKFLQRHTFYLGSEDQDPDYVIESYEGVGNAPAYPGTVYMRVNNKELTESGGAIPQYEFVVSICGITTQIPGTLPGYQFAAVGPSGAYLCTPDGNWSGEATTGGSWIETIGKRIVIFQSDDVILSDDYLQTTQSVATPWGMSAPIRPVKGADGKIYTAAGTTIFWTDDGENWDSLDVGFTVYKLAGDGDSFIAISHPSQTRYRVSNGGLSFGSEQTLSANVCLDIAYGAGMYMISVATDAYCHYSLDGGATFGQVALPAGGMEANSLFRTSWGSWLACNRVNSNTTTNLIARSPDGALPFVYVETPHANQDGGHDDCFVEYKDVLYCIAKNDSGTPGFKMLRSGDDGRSWQDSGANYGGDTAPLSIAAIDVAIVPVPDAPGWYIDDGELVGPGGEELERCRPSLAELVTEACLRSGLTPDDIDVSELEDDLVDGFKVATETTGEAIIAPLMQGWFFDAAEFDDKIRFIKRGGNVVAELDVNDLCETDGDVIEEAELQEVELLRKVHVRTIDPEAGFIPTTQTAERRTSTVAAVGEQTTEIAVVTDKDTQAQVAEKKMKVGWSEVRRFKTCIPYTRPELTPTDVIGLTDAKGRRQRVRLMEMSEDAGRISIDEAMLDRQSSYTSNVEGVPKAPPTDTTPGLVGPTFGFVSNLPRLQTSDIGPGAYLAACGYLRGWGGCAVQLSVDGGVSYQQVMDFTEASTMGVMAEGCTESSEPLYVFMNAGTLSSITSEQFALRMNAFAIKTGNTSEIGQFENAQQDSSGVYALTETVRGVLGTVAAAHNEGDAFVMLSSVKFLPLDLSLAGRVLYFKFVSYGTSPDDASPIPFVFDPLFFGAPVIEPYTDDAGNVYTDEVGNVYYYEAT